MNTIDVINKTPKENESFILKKANKVLLMDKTFLVLCILFFQLTKFGFIQFLPMSDYLAFYITAMLFTIFMIVLCFSAAIKHSFLTDDYVNSAQYEELKTLAKENKIVGKYLFLVRVSGRPAYLAEYRQLIKLRGRWFPYGV